MGITETRSRGQAMMASSSADKNGINPSLPSGAPPGGELIQDRVARHRLEKRMKRRKAQKERQNMVTGLVMLALFVALVYLGYRGFESTTTNADGSKTKKTMKEHLKSIHGKVKEVHGKVKGTVKDRLASLQRFHKDAPHAGGGGGGPGKLDVKNRLGKLDPRHQLGLQNWKMMDNHHHDVAGGGGVTHEHEQGKMMENHHPHAADAKQEVHVVNEKGSEEEKKDASKDHDVDKSKKSPDGASGEKEVDSPHERNRRLEFDAAGGGKEAEAPHERTRRLELTFAEARGTTKALDKLKVWADQVNRDIANNVAGGIRFIRSYLLPPLDYQHSGNQDRQKPPHQAKPSMDWMHVHRGHDGPMQWETEWKQILSERKDRGPVVDYTDPKKYTYPKLQAQPPPSNVYPVFKPLGELMQTWNHDEDFEGVFEETLMHFNYSNPEELELAKRYREAKLPFKLYDVPELREANKKWTDDYLSDNFVARRHLDASNNHRKASGTAQESPNNYFAFFTPNSWSVNELGLPPVTDNDWSFRKWSDHAKYADSVRLSPDKPHFYWQSGIPKQERERPKEEWTFISRDLPSMSSPTETFFVWHPEEQKGIQCRFGERGVVAATHYDSGRNMVAMVTGAKRYILSPPRACSKLGIFTKRGSPIYRHSLLNFAHIPMVDDYQNNMSTEERAWLKRASVAEAIDTVVKAGEVLYIPSFWFHYIVSLQKSAQCNVRSGIDMEVHHDFGGPQTVDECREQ